MFRGAALSLVVALLAGCGGVSPSATPAPSAQVVSRPSPSPSPTPTPTRALALVSGFLGRIDELTRDDLAAITAKTKGRRFTALLVVDEQRAAAAVALGVSDETLTPLSDRETLRARLLADPALAAVIPADWLEPALHELAWEGQRLTGVARQQDLAAWPLWAELPPSPDEPRYDPATAWTLVAGGDILLERGVAYRIRKAAGDANYPFDGGYARVTGTRCCGLFGDRVSTTKRAGQRGAVRALLAGADLAIANLESPTPVDWVYHNSGTRFTGDPRLLAGVAASGIDWLSLANNHIGDGGREGILETISAVERYEMAHGGAGRDLAAAQAPWITRVGGVDLAIIAVDAVAPYYHATAKRPGAAPFSETAIRTQIADARAAGADYVIVFPHWGVEFQAQPTAGQRRLAAAAIEAGADFVVGGHSHWASAYEVIDGKPVLYGMGNFVFDQNWSVETAQGLLVEATFAGSRMIALRLHPTEILEQAQPNFLDPAESGDAVLSRVERGSRGLPGWQ